MTPASLSWSSSPWLHSASFSNLNSNRSNWHENARLSEKGAVPLTVLAQRKVKKIRKVILKEDIPQIGKKGEMLNVRAGFYRNYLLPLGKAQLMTPLLLKEMRLEQERIEAEKKRVKDEAEQLALVFETVGAFKVKRKGGKGKQIFGSVTAQDLVEIIKAQLRRDVDKKIITLPEIREAGEYIAELKLHPEVTARVRVNVYAN